MLGHSSVAMSLRYAHLAPDQRREAVAKLNEKPRVAELKQLKIDIINCTCGRTKASARGR